MAENINVTNPKITFYSGEKNKELYMKEALADPRFKDLTAYCNYMIERGREADKEDRLAADQSDS